MKINQLRQIIKEAINEITIDEMARTMGTGAKIKITDAGIDILENINQTKKLPTHMMINSLKILKALYQAKQEGKEGLTKLDIASSANVLINSVYRQSDWLIDKGYAEEIPHAKKEFYYTPKNPRENTPKNPRQQRIEDILGDLIFLVKHNPSDSELGAKVRDLYGKEKDEEDYY
jgi:hypothetical protein